MTLHLFHRVKENKNVFANTRMDGIVRKAHPRVNLTVAVQCREAARFLAIQAEQIHVRVCFAAAGYTTVGQSHSERKLLN